MPPLNIRLGVSLLHAHNVARMHDLATAARASVEAGEFEAFLQEFAARNPAREGAKMAGGMREKTSSGWDSIHFGG